VTMVIMSMVLSANQLRPDMAKVGRMSTVLYKLGQMKMESKVCANAHKALKVRITSFFVVFF
jgi:hypothetical protein